VFDSSIPELPSVNHREYTTITTGNNEETGYPNISLHYQMFTKDVVIQPGTTTLFQTGSSMYPYERLNVNDASFVGNGSIGGLTPAISDHIVCGDKLTEKYDGGTYLTTWLSAGDINTPGIWVDRYYLPDLTTKQQAFSSIPVYSPTFQNSIEDLIYNNANYVDEIKKSPTFDKKSDVVLKPQEWYEYHRVGSKDIEGYTSNIEGLILKDFNSLRTYNGISVFDTPQTQLELKGNTFTSIPSISINKFNSFTLKFEYDIDWNTNDFYQLIGNNYNSGFGIFKNNNITPFVYVIDDKTLKVFNTNLLYLFETIFINPIATVVVTPYLGDLVVVDSAGDVYKVSTGGVIRQNLKNVIAPGYVSWTQDSQFIYFLYSGGSCIKLNINSLVTDTHTITPFNSEETVNSITEFNGIIYGVTSDCVKYNNTFGFISVGKIVYRYNFKTFTREPFLETETNQPVCTIDDDGFVYIADTTKITKFTKNRQLIGTTSTTSLSSTPIRFDTISEFDESGMLNVNILYVSQSTVNNSILATRYTKDFVETLNVNTGFTSSDYKKYVLTNYNIFNHEKHRDTVRISIALVSLYDRKDINIQYIDIPTQNLSKTGTFVIRCDTNQGNFTVFNNYQKIGNISFDPARYRLDDLFYDDIFIGTAGMSNNTALMNVINIKDHYTIQNATISNIKLYNKPLMDYEVHGLLLESQKIQDLVLTIPCGQRNNIEEIRRLFFFQPPNSKSTDINVLVKNSTIITNDLQNTIKDRILIDIKKYIPGHVNINDITFTTYKDDEN
jgi:hypothetical protein